MLKKILLVPFISLFVLAFYYSELVFAQTTDQVTATVTVQNIALSVSDGDIAYGTLALSSYQNTSTLTQTQTITNDGNVAIDVGIIGTDSTAWTLETAVGANQYVHSFCTTTCGTYPGANYTSMNADTYTTVTTGLASLGTKSLDLGISTPSSSSSYLQQSVNVTVQASASS